MRYSTIQEEIFAFKDIIEKEDKSRYLDWYFIERFPLKGEKGETPNFKCFGYYGGMPKLNLKNPEVENSLQMLHVIGLRNAISMGGEWM